jgi:DNA polymerase-3 subunit alpha
MTAKAVVRDTGRALGMPYAEVDRIAKLVPPPILGKHAPLADSIQNDNELNAVYQADPDVQKLLDTAARLDGTVRHAGTHACAVVISEKPLIENAPLQRSPADNDAVITQYSMKPIEQIGLLKMDFLGLKNLTLLETAIKIIKRTKNADIVLTELPFDDKKTFELFQKGETSGVFQLESPGMKRYLKQLKPKAFEDIIAMISLYRPGPMEWIPSYIKGARNPKKVKYLHASFEKILKETYGVAIYQEQILQIARDFAGFSLGEADLLRKAVGKKIPKLLQEQHKKFVEGAVKEGHKEQSAHKVFEKVIEPFAGYGFNKAHATSYAMISYQTAYLKAHYPTELMTALMSCDYGNTDKIVLEIIECEKMGIKVLPPSVNESMRNFTYVDDKTIRFGLAAIKGIGDAPARLAIEAREDKPFKDLEDFIDRVPQKIINKKLIEALAYSGAMDEFGERNQIAQSTEEISTYAKFHHKTKVEGQTDIFGMIVGDEETIAEPSFQLKKVEPAKPIEKLKWEKEYLGLYVSSHPLQGLTKYFSKKAHLIKNLTHKNIGKKVTIGGLITQYKKIFTRSGAYMASFVIEDPTGKLNVIIFPKTYQQFGHLFNEDEIVIMTGKLDDRRGQVQFVCEEAKAIALETMIKNAKKNDLFDPDEIIIHVAPDFTKETDKSKKVDNETVEKTPGIADEEKANEPFIIDLPESCSPDILSEIKRLLTENKGDTPCEIHIRQNGSLKRIKVPFGINTQNNLPKEIDKLIVK